MLQVAETKLQFLLSYQTDREH